jgi:hypothetical protein
MSRERDGDGDKVEEKKEGQIVMRGRKRKTERKVQ